jgi:hypothetical protein
LEELVEYDRTITHIINLENYEDNEDFVSLVSQNFFQLMSHSNYLDLILKEKPISTKSNK